MSVVSGMKTDGTFNLAFCCRSFSSNDPINTTPTIIYKRESLTRYVIVLEDTKDMIVRVKYQVLCGKFLLEKKIFPRGKKLGRLPDEASTPRLWIYAPFRGLNFYAFYEFGSEFSCHVGLIFQ